MKEYTTKWIKASSSENICRKKYGDRLEKRLFNFAVEVFRFLLKLPTVEVFNVFKIQLSRSGTSIGANYEEAIGSVSRKEFVSKLGICLKEAKETNYWLRIANELNLGDENLRHFLLKESIEFVKIFTSSLKSARSESKITKN